MNKNEKIYLLEAIDTQIQSLKKLTPTENIQYDIDILKSIYKKIVDNEIK